MATAHEKGTALEAVVVAIESLILQSSPAAKEKSHLIESRKKIDIDGVGHEIDLYVTTEIAVGYRAIFIFECKNWKDKVDKNEIIVFSEKIKACNAQHGYFVAKSFTSDAEAQAKKDSRMTLKIVTEHDPASTILPFGFHYTFNTPTGVKISVNRWGGDGSKYRRLDVKDATVIMNGNRIELQPYAEQWVTEAINESMRTFPSGTLTDGLYDRSCQSRREFAGGQCSVDGLEIESIDLDITFQVHIKRPAIRSHFEVGGRGRVISLEGYTYGAATIDTVQLVFGPGQI